jgi:hypothetical protein
MAPKRTRKLVHETMVEKPTQGLNVPSKAIRKEEPHDSKNKRIVKTALIMKMKKSNQPQSFSL